MDRERFERLSGADLMMLRAEDFGWREGIGALVILDGRPLVDAAGGFEVDAVRDLIGRRLHLVPRFRHLLCTPPWWLGRPCWIDAPTVALDAHVRVLDLPPGASERELLQAVERLRRRPFDRARPLWEMWFLPGLAHGRVGLYVKLHHAVADGVAGVALLGAFLDLEPAAPPGPNGHARAWRPRPRPTRRALLADAVRGDGEAVAAALAWLLHPVDVARQCRKTIRELRETLGQEPAPVTTANLPIGDDRQLHVVRGDLALVKATAHAHGATVNDVLMAAVAGGYRALLAHRGERVDDLVLRASVPVSLHGPDTASEELNDDGLIFVSLPVGVGDATSRLRSIAAETRVRKQHVYQPPSGGLMESRIVQRALWRAFAHQRWSNAYVANVPGPSQHLFVAGARVDEVFAIVPIVGNLTVGVGAISYAGQFNITVVADVATCPDAAVFTAGVSDSLPELARSARTPVSMR